MLIRNSTRISVVKVLSILTVLLSFLSTPFITPDLIGSIYRPISLLIMVLLIYSLIIIGKQQYDEWDKIVCILIGISLLHGSLLFLFYCDEEGGMGLRTYIGFALKYLLLIPVCWLLKKNYTFFLKVLWYPNLIIIILSIFLFFLLLGGVLLPFIEFAPDGRPHYFFYIGATNSITHFGSSFFIRTAGFTDEPGRLALMLSFLLVLNEFTFRKNVYRVILILAGFFTFSVAFIITTLPIIIYWIKIHLFKSIVLVRGFITSFLLILFCNIFISQELSNDIDLALDGLIFGRFESDGDGGIHGDSRSENIPFHIDALFKYPILGMSGKEESEMGKYHIGSPSLIGNMARNGIVFDLIYYFPFFFLSYKFRTANRHWLFIALGLNFLQRPGLEHMFFLIVCSLIYHSSKYAENRKTQNSCHPNMLQ